MYSLSIVIPAYNEEKRLPSTLDRVLEYLRERQWTFIEILVVDDGSTDGTAALVNQYRSRFQNIQLLSNPGNRGKGYSVRHGMQKAVGDWRLITDADLSAPIEELDKLLAAAVEQKAEISIGSRGINPSLVSVHQPMGREFSGLVFNRVMRMITGLPFRDTQCGFKLFQGSAAKEIFRRQRLEGFGFDVEDLFIARKLGFKAVEVAVRWANVEGTSVSLLKGSMAFWDLLLIRWNQLLGRYR